MCIAATLLLAGMSGSGNQRRATPFCGDGSGEALPPEFRACVVRTLDSTVRVRFAHAAGVPGLSLDSLSAATREKAVAASDRRAFDLTLMEYLASLKNGHTGFTDRWLIDQDGAPLPISVRWVEGSWAVTGSEIPTIVAGDVIEKLNDQSFESYFRQMSRFVPASSQRAARVSFVGQPYLFPKSFTITTSAGRPLLLTRVRASRGDLDTSASAVVSHRWLTDSVVAYIRIRSFAAPRYESEALELLRRYERAATLVLDVRGNGGGSTPWRLARALGGRDRPPFRIERDLVPSGVASRLAWPVARLFARTPHWPGRVLLLTNIGCASACEDLVASVKGRGRVRVIGDTTFGSTGQPVFLDFGNGMTARVGARRYRLPDGEPFEGVGLAPDIYIAPSIRGIRDRRDVTLDSALQLALVTGR